MFSLFPKKNRTQQPSPAPNRAYAVIVVSLAITVAGLVFWSGPPATHVATATIEWVGPGDAGVLAPHIRERLVGEEFLRQCLLKAGAIGKTPPSGEYPTNVQIQRLRGSIAVELVKDNRKQFILLIAHPNRQRAVALVDVVSEQLLANVERARTTHRVQEELKILNDLREQETKALQQITQLVDDVVAYYHNGDHVQTVAWLQKPDEAPTDIGQDEVGLNPEWLKMQRRLHEALDQRERMRGEFRPDDPELLRFDESIRVLQKALKEIPRDDVEIRRRAAEKEAQERPIRAREQLQPAWLKYKQARTKRIAIEQAMLNEARVQPVAPAAAFVRKSAKISQQIGGRVSKYRGLVLCGLGLVVGVATLFTITPNKTLRTLFSAEQSEETLGVRIVGDLPSFAGEPAKAPKQPNQIAWIIIRTAETLLGIIVAGVLLVALVDSSLTSQFANDPLSAFGEAFARILQWRL